MAGTADEQTSIDRKGFEAILRAPLEFRDGKLLLHWARLEESIEELERQHGVVGAQRYWNHLHLLTFAPQDPHAQRALALELIDHFRARAREICPAEAWFVGEVRDDACDIEVTFWVKARET